MVPVSVFLYNIIIKNGKFLPDFWSFLLFFISWWVILVNCGRYHQNTHWNLHLYHCRGRKKIFLPDFGQKMVKIAILSPAAPNNGVKNQNLKKSLCSPLDTPKRYLWSKFGVSRAFLASDLRHGVILRYCAICAQNAFSPNFWQNRVRKSIFSL